MLTVVIPSYNHEAYIAECLSAACNIDVSKRIILIDDGSTDNTVRNAQAFVKKNNIKDIEIIIKPNSGLVSSLNLALAMTETEFFYIVASDDIPDPLGIAECTAELIAKADCGFVIGGGYSFAEVGTPLSPVYGETHRRFFNLTAERRRKEIFLNYPNPILIQSTVFRTSALKKVGGWDSNVILDDYAIFIKLLLAFQKEGEHFIYKPSSNVVAYRQHAFNSYRNIQRQYNMVRQVMGTYAPDELIDRSLAKITAYYVLVSMRRANYSIIPGMMRELSIKRSILFAVYVAEMSFRKVFRF